MDMEALIKSKLDGWFFRMTTTRGPEAMPMVRAIEVPKDYTPEHRPEWDYLMDDSKPHHNAAVFTVEEDDIILTKRTSGARWAEISKELGRCIHSVRDRYKALCLERGIEPIVRIECVRRAPKFTDAEAMAMIELRDRGLAYGKIGKKFGCVASTVRESIERFQRRQAA
jgi:hypothetical protein